MKTDFGNRPDAVDPDDELLSKFGLTQQQVVERLERLTFREKEILKLRLAIGDGNEYTLEEVGRIFKITRERVRQIETTALSKIRLWAKLDEEKGK